MLCKEVPGQLQTPAAHDARRYDHHDSQSCKYRTRLQCKHSVRLSYDNYGELNVHFSLLNFRLPEHASVTASAQPSR
jgi:hypothetical protein